MGLAHLSNIQKYQNVKQLLRIKIYKEKNDSQLLEREDGKPSKISTSKINPTLPTYFLQRLR